MNNFPSLSADIMGGLEKFRFAELQDCSSFTVRDTIVRVSALSSISATWYDGYSTQNELKFTDEGKFDGNGPSFNKTIEGFFPGDHNAALQLFNSMAGKYFILYIKDNDGKEKIVGSVEEPLIFTFTFASGNPRGKKGYAYKFTGSGREKSPAYDPTYGGGGGQHSISKSASGS